MTGDWQIRLADSLTHGDLSALPGVLMLIGALIACSLFALIQFFTMMMSRWGDKNPAGKSFFLSILVHVVVILAWSTAVTMRTTGAVMALPRNLGETIPIHAVEGVPDGDDDGVHDEFPSDDAPVWKKLIDGPGLAMQRKSRDDDEPAEMELGEAPLQPSELPALGPAELSDLSSEPLAAATPAATLSPAEMRMNAAPAPVPAGETGPTAEVQPEAGARLPARSAPRRSAAPADAGPELAEGIPRTRGSGDPGAQNLPGDLSMSIPLEAAGEGDDRPVLQGFKSNTIRQGTSPAPSSAPEGEFLPDGRADGTGSTAVRTRRFDRTKPGRTSTTSGNGSDGDSPLPGAGTAVAGLSPNLASPGMAGPRSLPGAGGPGGDATGVNPTPSLATGTGPRLPNRSPATYKHRKLKQRRGTALQQGGSLESEQAVENSLQWLAKVQEPAGHWVSEKHGGGVMQKDPHGNDRRGGGLAADSGITGLALLAFMGAGYTQDDGEYADNVNRGLKWLIHQQRDDGYLGGRATHFDQMYCHAIATFALAEACGMQEEAERSPELKQAVRLAVEYIVDRQGVDGGWRYKKEQDGDMSMFGWQLMALKSADIAGIKVQPDVWNLMIEFLKKRSLGENNGLAAYNLNQPQPTPAMTAEALFCKQMIGIRRSNPACQEAVGYLKKALPRITSYDEYYWYYGTLAMFQHGGDEWVEWNAATRELLIRLQQTSGKNAGSWDPKGKWAGNGGRIYSTALSTLILEVYYRYLPLYQSTQE